jgi:hypothetical protein
MADPVFWGRMAQIPAPSPRADDRLATRVAKSPPLGILSGGIAILVMVMALAGVIPRVLFVVAAAALVVIAYTLDKRFKANAPPAPAAPDPSVTATSGMPAPPAPYTSSPPASASTAATVPAFAPVAPAPGEGPAPALLPVGDLQAEHARLTQELTERVDDDEDVRFEKFMRLRKIEEELGRQQAAPPS